MRIITVGREFGSGGRELGKRMSDILGWSYYDKEIIGVIAKDLCKSPDYVERTMDSGFWRSVPLTFRRTFYASNPAPAAEILAAEKRAIEGIASLERDAVIVGRNADVILRDYNTFNIFVCADRMAKLDRCMERQESGESLSLREMERKMKHIDQARRESRAILTDAEWGDRSGYHLIVDSTGWDMKKLAAAVSYYALSFFGRDK